MNKKKLLVVAIFLIISGCATVHKGPRPIMPKKAKTTKKSTDFYNSVVFDSSLVFFKPGKKSFGIEGQELLKKLVPKFRNRVKKYPKYMIRIEGHSDSQETKANPRVSLFRANSVGMYLVRNGVPKRNIRIAFFSDKRPGIAGKNREALALNRRVEIIYPR